VPVKGNFYYIHGDDTDIIEKKWLPDLQKKHPNAQFLRYDASIDELPIGRLVTEYFANDLFSTGKVIVIRNAELKQESCEALASALLENPIRENALVFLAGGLNGTTKLGKLAKKSFIVHEFAKPEIKPFDLLDALNCKTTPKVLFHASRLFSADFHPLALFSLLCGHFTLLKQVKDRDGQNAMLVARELKQHEFRIKKAQVANRYWTKEDITRALQELAKTGDLLRTWQYDERMLLEMMLIKLCI